VSFGHAGQQRLTEETGIPTGIHWGH